jgi:hypothetical protein
MPLHEREQIGLVEDDPIMGAPSHIGLSSKATGRFGGAPDGKRSKVCVRRGQISSYATPSARYEREDVFLRVLPRLGCTPFLLVIAFGQIEQAVRLTKGGRSTILPSLTRRPICSSALPGRLRSSRGPPTRSAPPRRCASWKCC